MPACSHLEQIRLTTLPASIAGCEECLATGGHWVKGSLIGKVGSAFTSTASQHGIVMQYDAANDVQGLAELVP